MGSITPTKDKVVLQVSKDCSGSRLDSFLAREAGLGSLRLVRGRWGDLQVRVNRFKGAKGQRLNADDLVSYCPLQRTDTEQRPARELQAQVQVVARSNEYLALFKPAGMHTQSPGLRGKPGLEDMLGDILPAQTPLLLNRLDRDTSGLILLAADTRARKRYQEFQEQGKAEKRYLALVQGRITGELCLQQPLDTAHRRKVQVLEGRAKALRWTYVQPLACLPGAGLSLVRIIIQKGARHQIRAHLAYCGHPVHGDQLYAGKTLACRLFLHHYYVSLPGFQASCLPGWRLQEKNK